MRFVLATAVSAALLTGIFTLKLASGGVSLGPATPLVEAVLNDSLTHYRVALGETQIAWSRAERKLDLILKNARLETRDGQLVATVPEMTVDFSAAALSHGLLAPGIVELVGPKATMIRRADGGVQLGFSAPDADDTLAQGSSDFFSGLVGALRGSPETEAGLDLSPKSKARLAYLNTFIIRNAEFSFYDAASQSLWRAPQALLRLSRTASGVALRLNGAVEAGKGHFTVAATAMLPHRSNETTVTMTVAGLNPSALAMTPNSPLAVWSGVNVPLRGEAAFKVDSKGAVTAGDFWLFAGAGKFAMPGLPSFALDLAMAEVKGRYDGAHDALVLERLAYKGSGNSGSVHGQAVLERAASGAVTAADLDLVAENVSFDMPTLFSEPGQIQRIALTGRVDPSASHFAIKKAELHAGEAVIQVSGDVDDKPEGLGLSLLGSIDRLAVSQFAKLWPIGPARGARDWIVANIPTGTIRSGTLKIEAKPGDLSGDVLPDQSVDVSFDFSDMTIDYLHGLTPITGASGHARLTGNRFELAMTEGRIGTLAATEGRYVVPDLSNRDVPATIAMRVQGEAKALLSVLDMPPLGYPSSYGFAPERVGGITDTRISLSLPMRKTVRFSDVVLKAEVAADGFSLPDLYRKVGIDDGHINVAITNDKLDAKGKVVIAGAPAKLAWQESFHAKNALSTHVKLSALLEDKARARLELPFADNLHGPVPLTLSLDGRGKAVSRMVIDCDLGPAAARIPEVGWSKPAGEPAKAHVALRFPEDGRVRFEDIKLGASDLDIRGRLTLGPDGAVETADLNPVKADPGTDLHLIVTRDAANGRVISLKGTRLDLSDAAGRISEALKSPAPAVHQPQKAQVSLGTLKLAHGVVLTGVEGRYATPGYGISDLAFKAAYADGGAAVDPGGGIVSARIEMADDARWLRVRAADTGRLLSGLGFTEQLVGGNLVLDAKIPPASAKKATGPVTGTVSLTDFRVKKAPGLAKLLTVASFGGIRDLMAGEGIAFESLELPFLSNEAGLTVGPGRAYGPAIGLTLQGEIARGSGDLDLSGTLVPAYTLNTMLGYVPVIGQLFVSREGEGLIALTYSVKGDAEDPRVFVNPLSALAPGFLRRIFQLDESNSAIERTGATPPPVQPQ